MEAKSDVSLHRFRKIALAEGVSFLVLLFIAMPLKYMADMPLMVKYVGWVHGILFVYYLVLLIAVWVEQKWSVGKAVIAFLASLIPFGTFIMDKKMLRK